MVNKGVFVAVGRQIGVGKESGTLFCGSGKTSLVLLMFQYGAP